MKSVREVICNSRYKGRVYLYGGKRCKANKAKLQLSQAGV